MWTFMENMKVNFFQGKHMQVTQILSISTTVLLGAWLIG